MSRLINVFKQEKDLISKARIYGKSNTRQRRAKDREKGNKGLNDLFMVLCAFHLVAEVTEGST